MWQDPKGVKQSWEEMYSELVAYRDEYGDCLVDTHETKLGRWVSVQRRRYKKGELDDDQIRDLESIGFVWAMTQGHTPQKWTEMLIELRAYKDANGNCLVPTLTTKLGRWVSLQRRLREGPDSGHEQLTEEQIGLLDELGFVWKINESKGPYISWEESYSELEKYHRKHGDCLIPVNESKLGSWVLTQRQKRKAGELSDEQIAKLDLLGFAWQVGPEKRSWDEMYAELKEYHAKNGHSKVPSSVGRLGEWVCKQRMKRKRPGREGWRPLTQEQVERLDALDFVWTARDHDEAWDNMFGELEEYSEKNGHCRVPTKSGRLGKWVGTQRRCRDSPSGSNRQLTTDQISRLDAIGFAWKADENVETWEAVYGKLVKYKEANGDCLVPQTEGKLGGWVEIQRRRKKGPAGRQKQLTAEQVRLLDDIGFAWTAADRFKQLWDQMYSKLKAFKDANGHCQVPQRYEPDRKLGKWVENQRGRKNGVKGKSPLTEDEIQRLEAIGFVWSVKKRKRSNNA